MYNDLNKRPIYDNTQIGLTLEFFSPINRKRLASVLSKITRKKVEYSNGYTVSESSSPNVLKLFPNFFGGYRMNKIQSGMMPYSEGISTALKIMNFINEYGFTNYKCKMGVDLRMNSNQLGVEHVQKINIFKFMLNIDEGTILEYWNKDNKEHVYKNSIAYIYPKNTFLSEIDLDITEKLSRYEFTFPQSKYFGLNFDKISEGVLNVRYVGGKDYQQKKLKVVELINDIIEKTHFVLKYNNMYSDTEKSKIARIMKEQRQIVLSLKNYNNFLENYSNLELYVDLKQDTEFIKSIKYHEMRSKIFELLVYGGINRGVINFDSDRSVFQIKNTRIREGFMLEGIEFYNSYIEGDLKNCKFYSCEIKNSKIDNSTFFSDNVIRYSAITECAFHGVKNKMRGVYIKNSPELLIEADIENSVIRAGTISQNSFVDDETEVVEARISK